MMNLTQGAKIVEGLEPQATDANPASAYVDVSNYHTVYVVAHVTKDNAALTSFALEQATSSAGAGNKVFANTVPVWSNLNTGDGDTLVRQANAINYALDNADDGRGQIVVFQIDPSRMDINNGFRWLRVQLAAGNADNLASVVFYMVDARYKQATPPSAV